MKVLVTGASGFIGKNFLKLASKDIEIIAVYNSTDLSPFLKEEGIENVTAIKCDLSNTNDVQKLFKEIGEVDHCLYLAGNVDVPMSKRDPKTDLERNAGAMATFLQHAPNFKRFVYMSTAGIYEGNTGKITDDTIIKPTTPYCISKFATEGYVRYFQSTNKIENYTIIRFSGAFGPYSKEEKFMGKLVREILSDKNPIEIYGDGTNMLNSMYVKDVIRALELSLKSDKKNVICNLGQDNKTVTQAVEETAKALGKDIEITYTERIKEQKYIGFTYDSTFNDEFNFSPEYSFEEGIKDFAKSIQ